MTSVDDETGCRAGVNATIEVDEAHVKAKSEPASVLGIAKFEHIGTCIVMCAK